MNYHFITKDPGTYMWTAVWAWYLMDIAILQLPYIIVNFNNNVNLHDT